MRNQRRKRNGARGYKGAKRRVERELDRAGPVKVRDVRDPPLFLAVNVTPESTGRKKVIRKTIGWMNVVFSPGGGFDLLPPVSERG